MLNSNFQDNNVLVADENFFIVKVADADEVLDLSNLVCCTQNWVWKVGAPR